MPPSLQLLRIGKAGLLSTGTVASKSWAFKSSYGTLRGCVTPAQIANMNKAIEGNFDYLDGYEELNEADKARVRQGTDLPPR
jgi:hypothetical protein